MNQPQTDTQPIASRTGAPRLVAKPRVDLYEGEQDFLLIAEVPGVDAEGLDIHVERDELRIQGTLAAEVEDSARLREHRAQEWRRSLRLPEGVDPDRVTAQLEGGVLTLRMAKSEKVRPRRIPTTTG